MPYINKHQNKHRFLSVLITSFVTSLAIVFPVTAAPKIDPKAQALLRQSAAVYQGVHSYSCQVRTEQTMDSLPGSRIIKIKLAYQSPNKAAAAVDIDGEALQYFTDGASLTIYSPAKGQYLQKQPPSGIPTIMPVLTQGQSFIGLLLIKPSGLSSLADALNAKSLTLGPREMLDGFSVQTVTKIMSGKDGGTMTMRVTLGVQDHLVHRFVSTIRSPKPLMPDDSNVRQIDNRETYSDLKINPTLPPATFQPPPDAKKVESDQK